MESSQKALPGKERETAWTPMHLESLADTGSKTRIHRSRVCRAGYAGNTVSQTPPEMTALEYEGSLSSSEILYLPDLMLRAPLARGRDTTKRIRGCSERVRA